MKINVTHEVLFSYILCFKTTCALLCYSKLKILSAIALNLKYTFTSDSDVIQLLAQKNLHTICSSYNGGFWVVEIVANTRCTYIVSLFIHDNLPTACI